MWFVWENADLFEALKDVLEHKPSLASTGTKTEIGVSCRRVISRVQIVAIDLKYECVYLRAYETGSEDKAGIGHWMTYYNAERPHSTHGILTPDKAYESKTEPERLAA